MNLLTIDGSEGEGGGQMLRTALGLSVATGTPFRMVRLRAGRSKPGLLRQHLACVEALAQVGAARTSGATLGSETLEFAPTTNSGGELRVAIGSAGSTLLVVQALLPALLSGRAPARVTLEGGTHAAHAPPFEHTADVLVPWLRALGADVEVRLERHGFYPAGGGRVTLEVRPRPLRPAELIAPPGPVTLTTTALVSGLPGKIGRQEVGAVGQALGLDRLAQRTVEVERPVGPGNALLVKAAFGVGTAEVFTAFGERGRPLSEVVEDALEQLQAWRALPSAAGHPVGSYTADQLLVPMALAGGGSFLTGPLSLHTTTNVEVMRRFLPHLQVRITPMAPPPEAGGAALTRVELSVDRHGSRLVTPEATPALGGGDALSAAARTE